MSVHNKVYVNFKFWNTALYPAFVPAAAHTPNETCRIEDVKIATELLIEISERIAGEANKQHYP